jgi:hypothetical protein
MMQHVLSANKSTVIRAHPIGLPSPKYISGPNKKDVRGSILFSKYLKLGSSSIELGIRLSVVP